MLSSKQYEAVGRLALSFNEIEWAFEAYMAHFIGAPEWSISQLFASEGTFRQKADRFGRLLKALGQDRTLLQPQIGLILELVRKAKDLAEKRNRYVHALVVDDFQTNRTLLRIKGVDMICNEAEINQLAVEAAVLAHKLLENCGELFMAVDETRNQEAGNRLYSTEAPRGVDLDEEEPFPA